MNSLSGKKSVLLAVAAGSVVFVAGLIAAARWLPEWRTATLPSRAFFQKRFRELAGAAGIGPVASEPRVRLRSTVASGEGKTDLCPIYEALGSGAADWLTAAGRGIYFEVTQLTSWPGGAFLATHLSRNGQAWAAEWKPQSLSSLVQTQKWPDSEQLSRPLMSVLLAPGESVGPAEELGPIAIAGMLTLHPVRGSRPSQFLMISFGRASREVGRINRLQREIEKLSSPSFWLETAVYLLVFLGVPVLFLTLVIRRRIAVKNGALLSCLFLLVLLPETFRSLPALLDFIPSAIRALMSAVFLFLLWSGAESWVRSRDPGFRTSLDALRTGRLGPRGGRALLSGLGLGAGLAGVRLAVMALAASAPGLAPKQSSISLPLFSPEGNFFGQGLLPAGLTLLTLALAHNLLSARWVPFATTTLGAFLLLPWVPVCPFLFACLAALLFAGILVFTYQRLGLAALLTASVTSYLLPAAVFSAKHFSWLGGSFAVAGGATLSIMVLGLVGLSRSPEAEARRLSPPAFIRRLEQERRVKYEMDLLARMQVGLLPDKAPGVPGYELAARSVLATEVGGDLYDFLEDEKGRLWIAAGDVSGHGYSCAIAQAMTKAALASLVKSDRTPSQVLQDADGVLRRGGSSRTFTSLALLRLDPQTGEGWVSNAGHPYPLLVCGGEVQEMSLPSFPLGQGPARQYRDEVLQIPPGGVLVFFSDGFVEATNSSEEPYGFDRPRELLRALVRRPAEAILEALLADWREHVGPEAPTDDTTLIVLKRVLGSSTSVAPLTPAS